MGIIAIAIATATLPAVTLPGCERATTMKRDFGHVEVSVKSRDTTGIRDETNRAAKIYHCDQFGGRIPLLLRQTTK
jgi:hypothetical protein